MARKFLFILVLGAVGPVFPAFAQIDLLQTAVPEPIKVVEENIGAYTEQYNTLKDQATTLVSGFPIDEIASAVQDPEAYLEGLKDKAADFGKKQLSKAIGSLTDLNASTMETKAMEEVKNNTTRVWGEGNSIEMETARQKALNLERMDNTALLYAKALVLRQELAKEEDEDKKIETVGGALKPIVELQIRSANRWNRILEMQAAINHYRNSMLVQSFQQEGGEDDEN